MKRILLTVLIGILIVAAIVVARLPASLVSDALTSLSPLTATLTRGTVWQGETFLTTPELDLGTLTWTVAPFGLVTGQLDLDWQLRGPGLDLHGDASAGLSSTIASVQGNAAAATLNTLLAPYDIRISNGIDINAVNVTIENQWPSALEGTVAWEGGDVGYRLSGRNQSQRLPAMTAILDMDASDAPGQPRAQVRADGDPTLLMNAALQRNGFAKVGITRHFTELVGMPWPGSDPSHAIVLEVEEQVF